MYQFTSPYINDEQLKQLRWAGIMEFTHKHIFARDFMPFLKELLPLLKHLYEAGTEDYLLSTLTYLFQADIENLEQVAKIIGSGVSASLGDQIMSLAEKLEQRGFKKGRAEGRAQEQREIARNMLQQNAEPLFIAKVTGLSLEDIQKLNLGNNH